jgi:hypothetical protein
VEVASNPPPKHQNPSSKTTGEEPKRSSLLTGVTELDLWGVGGGGSGTRLPGGAAAPSQRRRASRRRAAEQEIRTPVPRQLADSVNHQVWRGRGANKSGLGGGVPKGSRATGGDWVPPIEGD